MNKRGFTLVELIAVISILALLVIITTPAYDNINKNIRTRNFNSKKSVIEKQTLEYVENYLKDMVYGGEANKKTICFSVRFLIQNGIITSDDEKEEFIVNEVTGEKYKGEDSFISVSYDSDNRKLKTTFVDEGTLYCEKTYS